MEIKQADSFFYRIMDSQTEASVCGSLNTCKQSILRNNNKIPFYAGEWVKIATNDYITHFIKPTETLEAIAFKYHTTKEKLLLDNELKTDKLFIGQQLKIK